MLPYMLIAVPVYIVSRILFVKVKKQRTTVLHEITLLLFVVFLVGLASQTVIPKFEFGVNGFRIVQDGIHETNLIPFKVFADTYRDLASGHMESLLINFLGNIILFMPIGLMTPLLWNVSAKKTLLIGFCTSLFIETCQLLLPRQTDVDDLLLNTAGVALGILLFLLLQKYARGFTAGFRVPAKA